MPSSPVLGAAEERYVAEALQHYLQKVGRSSKGGRLAIAESGALGVDASTMRLGAKSAQAGLVAAAAATGNQISIAQVPQSKSYYCGPAAGFMILKTPKFKGAKSVADGKALSQSNLAGSGYMMTDSRGATTWASKSFVAALNEWTGANPKTWYQVNAPTVTRVASIATFNIDLGYAFAVDTVEFQGGTHYNGHPNRTLGHWLAGYRYSASGDTLYFADPAANAPSLTGFGATKPTFSHAASTFTSRYLQSNGIVG